MKRAIVLPGGGYTALGPALRIPTLAAMQHGYEPANVEYAPEALEAGDLDAIVDAAASEIEVLVADAHDVLLIPKSLGTRVIAAAADVVADVELVSAIFVTPVFHRDEVRDAIGAAGWRSLFAVGGADDIRDPHGDEIVAAELDARLLTIEGADHGLEVPGDLDATIAGFDQLAAASLDFVSAT